MNLEELLTFVNIVLPQTSVTGRSEQAIAITILNTNVRSEIRLIWFHAGHACFCQRRCLRPQMIVLFVCLSVWMTLVGMRVGVCLICLVGGWVGG